jgi:hypothetical protein
MRQIAEMGISQFANPPHPEDKYIRFTNLGV